MGIETYLALVPVGGLAIATVSIMIARLSVRRLERRERKGQRGVAPPPPE